MAGPVISAPQRRMFRAVRPVAQYYCSPVTHVIGRESARLCLLSALPAFNSRSQISNLKSPPSRLRAFACQLVRSHPFCNFKSPIIINHSPILVTSSSASQPSVSSQCIHFSIPNFRFEIPTFASPRWVALRRSGSAP